MVATFDRIHTVPKKDLQAALALGRGWYGSYQKSPSAQCQPFSVDFRENVAIAVAEAKEKGRPVRSYMASLFKAFEITDEEAQTLLDQRDAAICGF